MVYDEGRPPDRSGVLLVHEIERNGSPAGPWAQCVQDLRWLQIRQATSGNSARVLLAVSLQHATNSFPYLRVRLEDARGDDRSGDLVIDLQHAQRNQQGHFVVLMEETERWCYSTRFSFKIEVRSTHGFATRLSKEDKKKRHKFNLFFDVSHDGINWITKLKSGEIANGASRQVGRLGLKKVLPKQCFAGEELVIQKTSQPFTDDVKIELTIQTSYAKYQLGFEKDGKSAYFVIPDMGPDPADVQIQLAREGENSNSLCFRYLGRRNSMAIEVNSSKPHSAGRKRVSDGIDVHEDSKRPREAEELLSEEKGVVTTSADCSTSQNKSFTADDPIILCLVARLRFVVGRPTHLKAHHGFAKWSGDHYNLISSALPFPTLVTAY